MSKVTEIADSLANEYERIISVLSAMKDTLGDRLKISEAERGKELFLFLDDRSYHISIDEESVYVMIFLEKFYIEKFGIDNSQDLARYQSNVTFYCMASSFKKEFIGPYEDSLKTLDTFISNLP